MNNYNDLILIRKEAIADKFAKLSDWETFVICLYILGWTLPEIAERAGITKQSVSYAFRRAKMKMGIELNGQGN